ncbi:VOC family protein [Mycolicibacterium sp.]|uniref:VOC family protein n=1 Tax=Mycolicibacterium sp. TaxID=2320850 RepID=UPI003D0A3B17
MASFGLGHVGLNVTDIARSTAFYRDVVGFDVLTESIEGDRRFVFLGVDGALALTLWQQSAGEFGTDRPGLHHLALLVDDIDAVRAAEARVRAAGITPLHDGVVPHREGGSSGGIFFTDPDGIRVEIYSPAGADVAAAPYGDAPTCGFF